MARRYFAGFALMSALLGLGVSLRAQPRGGQVVAGAATFATAANALTVTQTSDRAIIHWQDFSLATGELARFVQPTATSATLNRVISGLPATLAGTLQANGRVYLINPNGILIGASARIDTAGFLASTLEVPDQEFLAGGDLHFGGDSTAAPERQGARAAPYPPALQMGLQRFQISARQSHSEIVHGGDAVSRIRHGISLSSTRSI